MYHTLIQDVNSVGTESGIEPTGDITTTVPIASTVIQAANGKYKDQGLHRNHPQCLTQFYFKTDNF